MAMSMTDPIADMLTRIRNAIMARHESVDIPYSNIKLAISKILKEEGYIKNYKTFVDEARKKFLKVYISYDENTQECYYRSEKNKQIGQKGLRESGCFTEDAEPDWSCHSLNIEGAHDGQTRE